MSLRVSKKLKLHRQEALLALPIGECQLFTGWRGEVQDRIWGNGAQKPGSTRADVLPIYAATQQKELRGNPFAPHTALCNRARRERG
jgi:hypothetical protein